ncbi:peroxisomal N(1)-acetyl-spermine/spermidine oxidase-like [Panonychus citri]|uniref:peroxisomal N(1)-acetyl-spermine/spermidine oxidase-like n=1 Tax=Panonychus citri TaxID=50023 RepID=UPI002307E128|nr:peroxisomal N(1)-acetyl-spermine/spermidine oxidase-like [Panonychus citri]
MIEENESENCDIIIIGAGMSGVSCAYHLIVESNYKGKVIILEGRNRVGGRMVGETIDGQNVELGANWIHGIINNPIYDLAVRYKLIDPSATDGSSEDGSSEDESPRMVGLTSAGDLVPEKTIASADKLYYSLLDKCENVYNEIKEGKVSADEIINDSVGEWMKTEIDKYLDTLDEQDRILLSSIFANFMARETGLSGCHSMDQVSLPYFGAYEELSGGDGVIPGGYGQLIDCLLDEIRSKLQRDSRPEKFQLILNHSVTNIHWPGIGSTSSQSTRVTTSTGKIYSCAHVVSTIPLGVLKVTHVDLFDPPLPQYKSECIQRMGFGVVDKVFIEFNEPLSPKFIDPSLTDCLTFWLPQDLQSVGWASKIYFIVKVSERCLSVWLTGEEAIAVETEQMTKVKAHLVQLIRKILKAPDLPDPINLTVTQWHQDPFSRGSYSYIATGSSVSDIENLAQPIYSNPGQEKPDLLFAGEACHPSFFSTVHGAFLTGRKAALYLIDSEVNKSTSESSTGTIVP